MKLVEVRISFIWYTSSSLLNKKLVYILFQEARRVSEIKKSVSLKLLAKKKNMKHRVK